MKTLTATLAAGLLTAAAACAAPDPAILATCLEGARSAQTDPMACLTQAHAPCQQISADTPAAVTLCFSDAHDAWTAASAARLTQIDEQAPEALALRARIEAKYDLLSGLLQCDRLEELGHLTEVEPQKLQMEKTRCEATASGMTYLRLLWRVTPE